ncbi:hypothetical protein PFISCL1PPCAC_23169, partial [Pristionchus fissidentatus]
QLSRLTLETLPKENLFQILSTLPMRNRRIMRACSKTMKESLEQIYLIALCVDLEFYGDETLTMTVHGSDDVFKLRAWFEDDENSVANLIRVMKHNFRRLRVKMLRINYVDHTMADFCAKLTEQFQFELLDLRFQTYFHQ